MSATVADVAVIGGTGFYSFLDDAERARRRDAVRRPVGAGRRRHGRRPPGRVPAAARPAPRAPAARDQLPRQRSGRCGRSASARCSRRAPSAGCATTSRPATSSSPTSSSTAPTGRVSDATSRPAPCHLPFADPYCAAAAATPSRRPTPDVTAGGTMVVIEGPRFSTRAESQHYAAQGWSLINMTGHPEAVAGPGDAAVLRRDRAGHRHGRRASRPGAGVGQEEVFALFAAEPRAAARAARRRHRRPARPGRLLVLDLGRRHRAHLRDPVLTDTPRTRSRASNTCSG